MRKLILFGLIISSLACKTQLVKNHKVTGDKTTYYSNDVYVDRAADSIRVVEYKRNGKVRREVVLPVKEVTIENKK